MIGFKEYLTEATVHDYMAGDNTTEVVPIYRVKSAVVLNKLNHQMREMRGIVFDDYIDVWDGWKALHDDYEKYLGRREPYRKAVIKLSYSGRSIIQMPSVLERESTFKRNIPIIQKMTKHPKVEIMA